MKPVRFEEVNVVLGENQPEYVPLPALVKDYTVRQGDDAAVIKNGEVVTCWELSDEEVADIVKNKRLYLSVLTFGKPFKPVCLSTKKEDFV